ncbi:hypothetical protein [Apis mellifera filamentous virus]|uniref:hypothetical protein n=1 Tax=Apis mellifera filamentous virus TaxID=1100043 RepID=UPI0006BC7423|nr:hypothetical protein APL35_gp221 [Apis mellifera filamentous virus]AKY03290.1 hypothetical protein [Apis mellifera filamentous virus]
MFFPVSVSLSRHRTTRVHRMLRSPPRADGAAAHHDSVVTTGTRALGTPRPSRSKTRAKKRSTYVESHATRDPGTAPSLSPRRLSLPARAFHRIDDRSPTRSAERSLGRLSLDGTASVLVEGTPASTLGSGSGSTSSSSWLGRIFARRRSHASHRNTSHKRHAERSTARSVQRPAYRTTEQSAELSAERSAERAAERSAERSAGRSAGRSADRSTERSAERSFYRRQRTQRAQRSVERVRSINDCKTETGRPARWRCECKRCESIRSHKESDNNISRGSRRSGRGGSNRSTERLASLSPTHPRNQKGGGHRTNTKMINTTTLKRSTTSSPRPGRESRTSVRSTRPTLLSPGTSLHHSFSPVRSPACSSTHSSTRSARSSTRFSTRSSTRSPIRSVRSSRSPHASRSPCSSCSPRSSRSPRSPRSPFWSPTISSMRRSRSATRVQTRGETHGKHMCSPGGERTCTASNVRSGAHTIARIGASRDADVASMTYDSRKARNSRSGSFELTRRASYSDSSTGPHTFGVIEST